MLECWSAGALEVMQLVLVVVVLAVRMRCVCFGYPVAQCACLPPASHTRWLVPLLGGCAAILPTWVSPWLAFVVFLATAQVVLGCSICLASHLMLPPSCKVRCGVYRHVLGVLPPLCLKLVLGPGDMGVCVSRRSWMEVPFSCGGLFEGGPLLIDYPSFPWQPFCSPLV